MEHKFKYEATHGVILNVIGFGRVEYYLN